jgi:hypothetical protein
MYEKYYNKYLVGKDIVEFGSDMAGLDIQGIMNCVSSDMGVRDASVENVIRLLDADINRTYL